MNFKFLEINNNEIKLNGSINKPGTHIWRKVS